MRKIAETVRGSPMPFTQLPIMLPSYIVIVQLLKPVNGHLQNSVNLSIDPVRILSVFLLLSFFQFRVQGKASHCILSLCLTHISHPVSVFSYLPWPCCFWRLMVSYFVKTLECRFMIGFKICTKALSWINKVLSICSKSSNRSYINSNNLKTMFWTISSFPPVQTYWGFLIRK